MRRSLGLLLAALGAGCGGDDPSPTSPFDKRVPRIVRTHLGRTLDTWLQEAANPEPSIRAQAAWSLGALYGATEQRAQALHRLLEDEHPDVRFAAVVAAGRVPLTDAKSAQLVLSQLGGARAMRRAARASAVYMGKATLAPLLQALKDDDHLVRWSAAWVALRLGATAEGLVSTLDDLMHHDREGSVRKQAALALAKIGEVGPARLAMSLSHTSARLRGLAEGGLRSVGPEGVKVLIRLLDGSNQEEADFAAGIFASKPSLARSAIRPLVYALDDEGPKGADAADALVRVGPDALDALRAAREKTSGAHRRAIAVVIERIQDEVDAKR